MCLIEEKTHNPDTISLVLNNIKAENNRITSKSFVRTLLVCNARTTTECAVDKNGQAVRTTDDDVKNRESNNLLKSWNHRSQLQ